MKLKNFIRRKDVCEMLRKEYETIQELIEYNEMLYSKRQGREKAAVGREIISLRIKAHQTIGILRYIEDVL